jgi:hypothetical protein
LYPHTYVPWLKGGTIVEYRLLGRIFCWNSCMVTSKEVEVTRFPTKVVNGSTNCGTVVPSRGVCGSETEANARQAAAGIKTPAPAAAPILRNVRRDGILEKLLSSLHAERSA